MATVLIQHGESGPDGTPPPRAYFQLIEGKLHMPTIRDYFRLANVALDGVVYPTDPDGFTFSTFQPNSAVRVTGDPLPGSRLTRILLIRTSEVYGEVDQQGAKRRVTQAEENLGLWTLPPPESQPRTLSELAASLRSFLQIEHSITWLVKYRYFSELVPISSDSALAEAFDHFRAMAAQYADDESAVSQQCRLYLNTTSEEMAPRDLIRARISDILDAAAAHTSGRETASAVAASLPPPLPAALHLPAENAAAAAVALLGSHHSHSAAAAAAALAAAGYGSYHLLQTQHSDSMQQDTYGNQDMDGDEGDDGDMQGDAGTLSGLLGIPRQSGSDGAGGQGGAPGQPKKESKTRHADGRFKNEAQHAKKMADMSRKIAELFDGMIMGMVEVVDHKKINCLLCNHACTAYSAYHTDCVRKHFLRHHEGTLRERGVDVARWRKEYEVSQKVKRQQQQHHHPSMSGLPPGMAGSLGHVGNMQQLSLPAGLLLNGLNALNGLNGDEAAQRGLQAQLLSLAGLNVDLQQLQASGNGGGGGGAGVPLQTVSALLLQAQAVSHDEQMQIQAAGAISGLMTAASVASVNGGQSQGTAATLVSQMSGALGGNNNSSNGTVSLAPMARMASGTVTTEMPLPPPPIPPAPQPGGGGGDTLVHEVASLTMTRAASVASQGHGSLPGIRSPPVVTTDMSQPSA